MYSFEGYTDCEASQVIAKQLGLSAAEKIAVFKVLNQTEEDPILVVRLNQNWITPHTEAHANVVLDSIATHDMVNARRDDQAPRLCFHFAEGSHIADCRLAVRNLHYEAFAPTPDMLDLLNAENTPWRNNREPLGFCVLVNKIGVRRNDILPFPFFYLQ